MPGADIGDARDVRDKKKIRENAVTITDTEDGKDV